MATTRDRYYKEVEQNFTGTTRDRSETLTQNDNSYLIDPATEDRFDHEPPVYFQLINLDTQKVYEEFKFNWVSQNLNPNLLLELSDVITVINNAKLLLWLNSKGDICYQNTISGAMECLSINKANKAIGCILGLNIKFTTTNYNVKNKDDLKVPLYPTNNAENFQPQPLDKLKIQRVVEIPLSLLRIIHREEFAPKLLFCFANYDWMKNSFVPSIYMRTQFDNYILQHSPILNFLYNISDSNNKKYLYLLYWLAAFFQSPGYPSPISLVFVGKNSSSIHTLFDRIITPLFNSRYCVKINNEMLELKGFFNLVNEKLFYCFNDISISGEYDSDKKSRIHDLITKRNFYIEKNNCHPKKFVNHAQSIIISEYLNIPYLDKEEANYTVFRAVNSPLIDNNLEFDLTNFSYILKHLNIDYNFINKPLQNDDRSILLKTLEEKVKSFAVAINDKDLKYFSAINNKDMNLYDNIVEDFENEIFTQTNLIKSFNILYPEEKDMIPESSAKQKYKTRTLMKMLQKVNNELFQKVFTNSRGAKYLKLT